MPRDASGIGAPNRRLLPHVGPIPRRQNTAYTRQHAGPSRSTLPSLCCRMRQGQGHSKAGPNEAPPTPSVAIDAAPATPVAKVHAGGMERFKDPGVYIDGVPTSVLRFGELPITLKPVWIEERAAVAFKKGDEGPRFRITKTRRYRFSDYFRELGVDLEKIKELHIYGGNQKAAAV